MARFSHLSGLKKALLALLILALILCFCFSFFQGGVLLGALIAFFYPAQVKYYQQYFWSNFLALEGFEKIILSLVSLYFLLVGMGAFLGLFLGLTLRRLLT